MTNIQIAYKFFFPDGRKHEQVVELDQQSGCLVSGTDTSVQNEPWTALEFNKCSHCPLNSADNPQCPVAKNLASIAHAFKDERSYSKVTVEVETTERIYKKNLPLQDGLFGLFGLIMATSECPYFAFLRPMARFHLPFSSLDETMVRSASFYLLKQYFVAQKGGSGDFSLKEFSKLYDDVGQVNHGIIRRIRALAKADADANSIVNLDAFASLLSSQAASQFSDLERYFP